LGDKIKNDELGWACGMYGDEHMGFWWADLRESGDLEDLGVDGKTIVKWIFKSGMGTWTGLIWLRTGTSDGLL
jgi:hypothetical protein